MNPLKGIHVSIGRVGTKAVADTLTRHADADIITWVDTDRVLKSPRYYMAGVARPLVMIYHHLIHFEAFKHFAAENPACPIAFTVRDPVANLKSFAKSTLLSFICGHFQEFTALARSGKLMKIADDTIARDFVPIVDYWRYWQTIKRSPNMIVEFSDLGEERFVDTMNKVCDFLHLKRTSPIVWPGPGQTDTDAFFIHYRMDLNFLDRDMQLFFSRRACDSAVHDVGPGLVEIGTFQSDLLDDWVGSGNPVHVHVKADAMLSQSQLQRERETFARLIGNPNVKRQIIDKLFEDNEVIYDLVEIFREETEKTFLDIFRNQHQADIVKFLRAHPWLEEKWQCAPLLKAA